MFLLNPKLWDTILTVVTTAFSTAMAPWQGTFFAADLAGVSRWPWMAMKNSYPKVFIFFLVFLNADDSEGFEKKQPGCLGNL